MSTNLKSKRVMNMHWWQYIKWRNSLFFIIFLVALILCLFFGYNSWANSVTSPSEKATLSFTVAPGGGGKGDTLVSSSITQQIALHRSGETYGNASFSFGPWDKSVMIREVVVHPIVDVGQNSTIEVFLSFKGEVITIGSFIAQGDPAYNPNYSNLSNLSFKTAHLKKSLELLIPRGDTGTIDIVAKDTKYIAIQTDTYVWFDVLQAKYGSVPSWLEIVITNPLAVGIILAILPFLFTSRLFYKTQSERRQEDEFNILKEIRDILKGKHS